MMNLSSEMSGESSLGAHHLSFWCSLVVCGLCHQGIMHCKVHWLEKQESLGSSFHPATNYLCDLERVPLPHWAS